MTTWKLHAEATLQVSWQKRQLENWERLVRSYIHCLMHLPRVYIDDFFFNINHGLQTCTVQQCSIYIYTGKSGMGEQSKTSFVHYSTVMSSLDRIFFISKRKPNNNPFGFHMFANKMDLTFISKHLFQIWFQTRHPRVIEMTFSCQTMSLKRVRTRKR